MVIAALAVIGSMAMVGRIFAIFMMTMFGLIFACGILIIYCAKKYIKQVTLHRYLLLAGASALGKIKEALECIRHLWEE